MNCNQEAVWATFHTITQSKLSDKERLIAYDLLTLAHPDNGHLNITWGQLQKVMGKVAVKTVKNRLGLLGKAGIIHYSTNETVDITFEAWRGGRSLSRLHGTGVPATRDDTHPGYTGLDAPSRLHGTGVPATRDRGPEFPPYPPDRLIYNNPIPLPLESNQSMAGPEPQPEEQAQTGPGPEEQARTLALLLDPDIGVSEKQAARLAALNRFDWVWAQVAAWWADPKSRGKAGGLVNRLNRNWKPGLFPEAFRQTAIYGRHVAQTGEAGPGGWATFTQAGPEETPEQAHQGVVASEEQAAPIGADSSPQGQEQAHGDVVAIDAHHPQAGAPGHPLQAHRGGQLPQDSQDDAHGGALAIDAHHPQAGPEEATGAAHQGVVGFEVIWAGVKDNLRETRLAGTVDRLALRSLNGRAVVVCRDEQTKEAFLHFPKYAGMVADAFQQVTGAPVPVEFVVGVGA